MLSLKCETGGHARVALSALLYLLPLAASAGTVVSQADGDWGAAGTWDPGVPGAADDVYIRSNDTVTINGLNTIRINSLTVTGTLQHADNESTEANKIILDITNDCTIATDGKIDVTGRGYDVNQGPGLSSTAYAGGSHGGRGGYNANTEAQAGATYGSLVAPTNCGSGGKTWGTSGGGVVQITAGGTTTIDGDILANGISTGEDTPAYGGGAGGSVFITTANFGGSGSVTANGGQAELATTHGAGGGGRVSIVLTSGSTFGSVDLRADRGASTNDTGGSRGYSCAGTVYTKTPSQAYGTVKVDNSGKGLFDPGNYLTPGTRIPAGDTWQVDEIELVNGGTLWIDDTCTLVVSNTGSSTTNGYLINEGTLSVPSDFVVSNVTFMPLSGSTFDGTNLTIDPSAVVTHVKNRTAESWSLELSVPGNLTVPSGAAIDVDGKGYAPLYGPGTILPGQRYRSGGSYGGRGGFGTAAHEPPGPTYGSITTPTNSGSGGGVWIEGWGNGGGAIKLTVAGTTSVDGSISADGVNFNGSAQGGGSGGSVWLTTSNLIGNGAIRANGGLSETNMNTTAGGGGGRIAVYLTGSSDFGSVNIQAYGGTNILNPSGTGYDGAAGTVYLQTQDQAADRGTLIVANRGVVDEDPIVNTIINANVNGTTFGDVLIYGKATLEITNDVALTVHGSWSNGYAFIAGSGTTVEFAGTNTATLYGSSSFAELICTNVSKQMNFAAACTTAVDEALTFTGPSDTSLVLRSTSPGTQWGLDLDGGAVVSIERVDVQDSDARPGTAATALDSKNSGNNSNWVFAISGQTNVWIGGTSATWGETANWSLGYAPIPADAMVVISNGTYDPSLPSGQTFNNLEIQAGAILSLAGFDLTVNGHVVIAGTLVPSGTETITIASNLTLSGVLDAAGSESIYVGGNLNFTGGTFTQATSHVYLNGTAAQSVTSGGESFYNLTVTNLSGLVTFADTTEATYYYSRSSDVSYGGDFTATQFHVYSEIGAVTQTFNSGSTYTFDEFWLRGSPGNTQHLASAGTWNLNVSGMAYVQGVNVAYSDASGGIRIVPFGSTDGGNNDNWAFGGPFAVWTGDSGSSFHTAGSWNPVGVPDETTYILVDDTTTLTVSSPATVMYAQVGGQNTTLMEINNSFTVISNLVVIDNGILEINDDPGMTVSNDVYVASGGLVNHNDNSTTEADRMLFTVEGDLVIAAGGSIDVTGLGYDNGQGPGKATIGYSGGSYGGVGGLFGWATSRDDAPPTYGSYSTPTNLGSGGLDDTSVAGGGAIQLNVGGTTTVNGQILAEGRDGSYAGGAGGSIFLTTAALAGSGLISADGGYKVDDWNHGAGGGGRIAVILTNSSSFGSVTITAEAGGAGSNDARGQDGMPSAGTIYTWIPGQTNGTLKVDAGGDDLWEGGVLTLGTKIPSGQTWQVDRLELVNGGALWVDTNTTVDIATGDFGTSTTNSTLIVFGTVVLPSDLTISNFTFMPHADCTLSGLTNLTIASNAVVSHIKNDASETYKLEMAIPGNLAIEQGGTIDVTAKGYGVADGPGTPSHHWNGGAHGGVGGQWNGSTDADGPTYGSVLAPTNAGSGPGSSGHADTHGGGIIRLIVGGAATVNGEILADGGSSPSGYNGGAGGSIYLTTAALSGAGAIRAGGGDPWTVNTGAGGGGRVSVVLTSGNSFDSVEFSARGGTVGASGASAPGTVYLQSGDDRPGEGRVIVDCKGEDHDRNTYLPPETLAVSNELVDATIIVTNLNSELTLSADIYVGDILVYTNADLVLGSYTMYVDSTEHHIDDASRFGTGGPTNQVDNYDQIVWIGAPRGTVVIFR